MNFKDYIILKDQYEESEWFEIFFFDHFLTNGELEKIEKAIIKVKNELPSDYTNEDVEDAICEAVPYINSTTYSETDRYHTFYF